MAVLNRDYMRTGTKPSGRGRARRVPAWLAMFAAALSAVAGALATSLVLRQGWIAGDRFIKPGTWPFDGIQIEWLLLPTSGAVLLMIWNRARRLRVMMVLLAAIGIASSALWCLSPIGKLELSAWLVDVRQRVLWRGDDGETLIAWPNAAKPTGERVRLVNNTAAQDPTYAELVDFLRRDKSDQQTYRPGEWVCACFAEQVHNNAELAGIRCAFVNVYFGNEWHACNLFRTTDRGLVYVDCTRSINASPNDGLGSHDHTVDVRVNQPYVPKFVFPSPDRQDYCQPMGIVHRLEISW